MPVTNIIIIEIKALKYENHKNLNKYSPNNDLIKFN